MTTITFFGNTGVLHKGNQSTVVRVFNIARKLRDYGYTCIVKYSLKEDIGDILNIIRNSDIIMFHRVQASRITFIDLKYVFAFLISKKNYKKIIFDFDDSIFLTYPLITETFILGSNLVFTGSHYLYEHAVKLNFNTCLIPSAVDTNIFKPVSTMEKNKISEVVIGWHGSVDVHFKNLSLVIPVIRRLGDEYDITFKLLGTRGSIQLQTYFRRMIPNVKFDFGPQKWVSYEELPSFMSDIDVSVSPLANNRWNRGKCAMKALESMALGIPVVASAVGEHNYIIRNGYNGFLASSTEEWVEFLSMLIEDTSLRREMGTNARKFIEKYYSLDNISLKIKNLIEKSLQVG